MSVQDIDQLSEEFMDAEKRLPGKRGPGKKKAKVRVTIRLDAEIVEYLRAHNKHWQTKANQVLSDHVRTMEDGRRAAMKLGGYVF